MIGSFATFDTYQGGVSLGGGTQSLRRTSPSLNAAGSDYFTDPPNPDNLNNDGNTQRGFIRLDTASPGFANAFRLSALLGRTDRDVPNRYSQEDAGQAERVQTYDQNYNLGWQNVLSASTVLDVTAYARLARFTLYPSAGDTPITADSNRSLNNFGITPSFSWTTGIHEIKVGGVFKAYPIQELFRFGITDPTFNDPSFAGLQPEHRALRPDAWRYAVRSSPTRARTSTTRPTCRTRSAGTT